MRPTNLCAAPHKPHFDGVHILQHLKSSIISTGLSYNYHGILDGIRYCNLIGVDPQIIGNQPVAKKQSAVARLRAKG